MDKAIHRIFKVGTKFPYEYDFGSMMELMRTSAVNSIKNSPQAIINEMRLQDKLPFQNVLSTEVLNKHLPQVKHRNRIFTPEQTLFCFLL